MTSNGSRYVVAVFAVLIGYFVYQWWFNPARAIKQRLGELAAALSVPAPDSDIARLERVAQLRRYLAADVRVEVDDRDPITSRDAAIAIVSGLRPASGGVDVHFVDAQVTVLSSTDSRAYLTVELATPDRQTGQRTVDSRDAVLTLAKRDGDWVITSAESKTAPPRP
jgi:hypothetical protein